MKRFFSGPYRFAILYGAVLAFFALFVVLDTFVIPHEMTADHFPSRRPPTSLSSDRAPVTDGESSSDTVVSGGAASDAEEGAGKTPSDSSGIFSDEPMVTATSYKDRNISIQIYTVREYDTDIHVAEVYLSSPEYLKTALAKDTYGRNVKEKTSVIAGRAGAIFAVNGDFYGFRNEGYVIRNGVLYREKKHSSSREDLVIDGEGLMYSVREGNISARELWDSGAEQVLSFGPVLVQDSDVMVDRSDEFGGWESNPRCAVGMIEPLHYLFVVSDGRTRQSAGLSLEELGIFMAEWDCTFAYNLDGGGSATMVFNGKVINNPTDGNSSGERKVSDIVCVGY